MHSKFTTNHNPGFFLISIETTEKEPLANGELDKALFLHILQQYVSPRYKLEANDPVTLRYADTISVVAFSLLSTSYQLVVHTTDHTVLRHCMETIKRDYRKHALHPRACSVQYASLSNASAALEATFALHSRHTAWATDRYCSIGFYLHDQRGDWMKLWHVSPLFQNDAARYHKLLKSRLVS